MIVAGKFKSSHILIQILVLLIYSSFSGLSLPGRTNSLANKSFSSQEDSNAQLLCQVPLPSLL